MMKAYKLVAKTYNGFCSYVMHDKSILFYKIGETITCDTPLFVFKEEAAARRFTNNQINSVILEGTVNKLLEPRFYRALAIERRRFSPVEVKAFWGFYTLAQNVEELYTLNVPLLTLHPSTYFAYDFTPTKIIHEGTQL
jgi:hypothetical protein